MMTAITAPLRLAWSRRVTTTITMVEARSVRTSCTTGQFSFSRNTSRTTRISQRKISKITNWGLKPRGATNMKTGTFMLSVCLIVLRAVAAEESKYSDASYRLAAKDVVEVKVYRQPDLDTRSRIADNGAIT